MAFPAQAVGFDAATGQFVVALQRTARQFAQSSEAVSATYAAWASYYARVVPEPLLSPRAVARLNLARVVGWRPPRRRQLVELRVARPVALARRGGVGGRPGYRRRRVGGRVACAGT